MRETLRRQSPKTRSDPQRWGSERRPAEPRVEAVACQVVREGRGTPIEGNEKKNGFHTKPSNIRYGCVILIKFVAVILFSHFFIIF